MNSQSSFKNSRKYGIKNNSNTQETSDSSAGFHILKFNDHNLFLRLLFRVVQWDLTLPKNNLQHKVTEFTMMLLMCVINTNKVSSSALITFVVL